MTEMYPSSHQIVVSVAKEESSKDTATTTSKKTKANVEGDDGYAFEGVGSISVTVYGVVTIEKVMGVVEVRVTGSHLSSS